MFQLEDQLQEWKQRFCRTEVMRSGDMEELEQARLIAAWADTLLAVLMPLALYASCCSGVARCGTRLLLSSSSRGLS